MATLIFATLLAGGGLLANQKRLKSKAAATSLNQELVELKQPTTLSGVLNSDYAVSSVLKRQIPNQRGLSQNIYNVNDLDVTNADLQNRAGKVYTAAAAKETAGKKWGQPSLDGLEDDESKWLHYAANPEQPNARTLSSFSIIPFVENEWEKNDSVGRKTGNTMDTRRRFEQMTSVGTGGYVAKKEVLNEINQGVNPVSTNLIDNVDRLNTQNMISTTFDGTTLDKTGAMGVSDQNRVLKNYVATRQKTIDDSSVDPGLKTFALQRGGNADRSFNAPALLPQNYQLNHRRNVSGTQYDQLQYSRQTTNSLPQGYNKVENMATIPVDKAQGKRISDIGQRIGNAGANYGPQGQHMGMISNDQGRYNGIPSTSLVTSQHTQELQYDPMRFTQISVREPMGEAARDNVYLNQTLKEDTLFSHQGAASNNIFSNASYLSRIEPLPPTNKETLVRERFGRAISMGLPQQSNYQSQMQDWKRDLQETNANNYETELHRTPGVYVPGDNTRYLPDVPDATNKELNASAIGAMGVIGGFSNYVNASAPRNWRASDRKMGHEFNAAPMITNRRTDTENAQLTAQEDSLEHSYKRKKTDAVSLTNFGGSFQAFGADNVGLDQFRDRWVRGAKKPKIIL